MTKKIIAVLDKVSKTVFNYNPKGARKPRLEKEKPKKRKSSI